MSFNDDKLLHVWNIQEQLLKSRIISLVGEVNNESVYSVCAMLDVLNSDDPSSRIILNVNTPGGSAYDCFALCDKIKSINAPVIAIVNGMAMSAGAAIIAACDRCYIMPHSEIMIHQVQSGTKGSLPDMKKDIERCDKLTDNYLGFISEKTGLSLAELRKKTEDDWYLSPDEAIKIGLCDGYAPVYKNKENVKSTVDDFENSDEFKNAQNKPAKKEVKKSK